MTVSPAKIRHAARSITQQVVIFSVSILIVFCAVGAGAENFPHYNAIRDNIAFWEKIYSTYSLTDAVIHDVEDLTRIYEVIPMLDKDLPGASRINRQAQRQAIDKYRQLLMRLAASAPRTAEEKRVAALFPGRNRSQEMRLAADRLRIQTGQKERFAAGVARSGGYLQEMKKIFRSYRLPEDLAYLPHVESSFNTNAYSKFGAAGMWQFTRATGKQYLAIDYTVDERLDPIAATHAAAKYLKNGYQLLGNWPLALTSYNYGLAGMLRAVKAKKDYVRIFNEYQMGHFKFASKNFYSEFLAALQVAKKLESSGAIKLDRPVDTIAYRLPDYIAANVLCNHFEISLATMKRLNPALMPPVFTGEKYLPKDYLLRLPRTSQIPKKIVSLSPSLFHQEQKPSKYHRVRKGDTAGSIAQLHRIPLKKLMQANNLDKYATIYLNQRLRLPGKDDQGATPAEQVITIRARSKKAASEPATDKPLPVLVAGKKMPPQPDIGDSTFLPQKDPTVYNVYSLHQKDGSQMGYITVQPEESLGLYAEWLGISISTLRQLNKRVRESGVSPGQQLLLPFTAISPREFEEKRLDFLQATEEDFFRAYTVTGRQIYRVTAGDTLWDLCYNKFEIPLWLLERYNSTINLSRLRTDQELIVPIIEALDDSRQKS